MPMRYGKIRKPTTYSLYVRLGSSFIRFDNDSYAHIRRGLDAESVYGILVTARDHHFYKESLGTLYQRISYLKDGCEGSANRRF